MKLGLITPVLSGSSGPDSWERHGRIDDVARLAQAAERMGYECLTCAEHVATPAGLHQGQPGAEPYYWDPLATFGYLAARTSRIRLAALVVPLPYHHPLAIVKRYGTLDRICDGRLILGVGVGYLKPEFELLGADFDGRNERSDDAIRAIQASFGRNRPRYSGEYYSFSDLIVDPCGAQTDVTLWVGGRTQRSLRRAIQFGRAWFPFAVAPDAVARWLAVASQTEPWTQRRTPLEIVLGATVDPLGDPAQTTATVMELHRAGANMLMVRFVQTSLAHCLEQIEAMTALTASIDL